MMNRTSCFLLLSIALLASPGASAADGDWQYRLTPYLWATGIDGKLAHEGLAQTFRPSASFSDVLDHLDAAGMIAFEANRGSIGVFMDLIDVRLSETLQVPLVQGNRLPIDTRVESTTALLAFQYRLREYGQNRLDILAGIRYWSTETRFRYQIPAQTYPPGYPIPQSYNRSERESWVDGQVGVKGNYNFGNGFHVGGWAMIGAGGADLATDLMLALGYYLSERTALLLGYRRLAADFSTSRGFEFDVTMHGPGLGLDIRF